MSRFQRFVVRTICLIGTFSIFTLLGKYNTVYSASIGVSPGGIYNENLKPGSSFTQDFIISRGDPNKTVEAEIEVDAEEFEGWLSIDPGISIILPAGEQRVPFSIEVDVPADAKYGKYDGFVRVLLKNKEDGQVSIQPAIRLNLSIIITEKDIFDLQVTNSIINDSSEGRPLVVDLEISNNGNIPSAPESLLIDIYSVEDSFITSLSTNEIPNVEPFETQVVEVEIESHELAAGTYIGNLTIRGNSEILLEDKSIFKIYQSDYDGSYDDSTSISEIDKFLLWLTNFLDDHQHQLYLFGGILLIAFLLTIILFIVDRKQK